LRLLKLHVAVVSDISLTFALLDIGIVGTAMWDLIDSKLAEKQGKKQGEVIEYYVKNLTALGRTSTPEDVSKLVSFLCSGDSDFVTGQTQVVDGGIIFT